MKNIKRTVTFTAFIFILLCVFVFSLSTNSKNLSASAEQTITNETDFTNHTAHNYAHISYEKDYELSTNKIDIPFTAYSASSIDRYTYTQSGFSILSASMSDNNTVVFSLRCLANSEAYEMHVTFYMSNEEVLNANLYVVYTEYGIFVSGFFQEDAYEKFLVYAMENEGLSEREADNLRIMNYHKGDPNYDNTLLQSSAAEEAVADTDLQPAASVNASSSPDTYAQGTLQWKDDSGHEHPLRRVLVELYDSTALTDKLLGSAITDNDGYFKISFHNDTSIFENGGYDLFIRVYAGDNNAYVVQGSNANKKYYDETSKTEHQNVKTGTTTDFSNNVGNTNDKNPYSMNTSIGKAFQISQALLTARDFAKEMKGSQPEEVKVRYPINTDSCYYTRSNKTITISGIAPVSGMPQSYASWDTIMHEYGHHISYEMNIIDSPGEWHAINSNMIDHYLGNDTSACGSECARHKSGGFSASEAKIQGEKIAWSESWATVFGLIAQDYYKNNLGGIPTVCNGKYEAYNLLAAYEIESCGNFLGEGCEGSIAAVLWDLFDSGDEESKDTISLGYQKWWNVTTGSQATTFSSFMKYFYSRYWKYIGEVGKNLEYYAMAPAIRVVNAVDEINANMSTMRFLWEPQGGSGIYINNNFQLLFYNEDFTDKYTLSVGNATLQDIDSSIFNNIKELKGQVVHVAIRGYHSSNSIYDGYVSSCIDFPKRVFTYSLNGDKATITGAYCDLIGTITIPATIDGYQIEAIGESAFQYKSFNVIGFANDSIVHTLGNYAFNSCPNLTIFNAPSSLVSVGNYVFTYCKPITFSYPGTTLTTIGKGAFMNTEMPLHMFIPESIETIGTYAFKNSSFNDKFALRPNSALRSIGSYAFENHTMKRIVLSNAVSDIGTGAFNGCENITIYTERSARPSTWDMYWNGSNRPVFWGCTLSSDKSYVVSFVKSSSNPANSTAINGISTPFRKGYTFNGWYTTSDFSGTQYTDVTAAPNGTLYAKWTEDSCIAEGSLITLADGSRVAVENLTGNEDLLVWNMLTGQFDVAPILFIDSDPVSSYEIIKLTFSDGTFVKVIDEHAFFDITLNKYVFLRNDAAQYVGHTFNKQTVGENGENVCTAVTLTDVTVYTETTTAWSPVTYGHLCYYVNGMLSMPGATEGFINIFEVDPTTMKYDEAQMAEDIAEYGLYTYEEFNEIIPLPEVIFNAFNGQYLKVSIGKGLITLDEIRALIERYSAFFAI